MLPTLPQAQGLQLLASMTQEQLDGIDDLPKLTTAMIIGIVVAITGNVLISLALNLQKLAHKRIEARTSVHQRPSRENGKTNHGSSFTRSREHRRAAGPSLDENDEDDLLRHPEESSQRDDTETQALFSIPNPSSPPSDYGATWREQHNFLTSDLESRILPSGADGDIQSQIISSIPIDDVTEESALNDRQGRGQKSSSRKTAKVNLTEGNETEYLRSKLWWLGFLLMNIGETGNFISYAWAPASVVAPLGTFALIANCVFAPLLLGEHFRKRDLFGIIIAIVGAVTVVLASNASDVRLDPDALVRAICQTPFIIFSCVYAGGAIILAILSHTSVGRRWVFVDVGICALFGGFTVLSTKAISTLLTMHWIDMFTKWITYPVLAVLAFTGVGQIRYLNRALMRFDGKVVIPVQFVLFTLSAIIGSAILYGDFRRASFHEIVTFLYGCVTTFVGVFIIAWAPSSSVGDDEEGLDQGDGRSPASESVLGQGTIGGSRRRATLILPNSSKDLPQHSLNLIGLSPAQHLLLVHTPPREVPAQLRDRGRDRDVERDLFTSDSTSRRRTMNLFVDHLQGNSSPSYRREISVEGRSRNGMSARVRGLEQG